jgi:hypothetical protein
MMRGSEDVVVPELARPHPRLSLYTIRHPRRDEPEKHLNAHGVQTAVNYPTALPFLEAYSRFKHRPEQIPNVFADHSKIMSRCSRRSPPEQQDEVVKLIRKL